MRLPIDTTTVKFAAAGPAEPVLDFETRQPKTDENGVPLFNVPVFATGGLFLALVRRRILRGH